MKVTGLEPLAEVGALEYGDVFEYKFKAYIVTELLQSQGWGCIDLESGRIVYMSDATRVTIRPDACVCLDGVTYENQRN